jgi:hypothetical protein
MCGSPEKNHNSAKTEISLGGYNDDATQYPDNGPICHKVAIHRVAPENVTVDPRVPSHVRDGTVRPASNLHTMI